MKATFDQHIGVFENAVPKEWCERVINIFKKNHHTSIDRQTEGNGIPQTLKEDNLIGLHWFNKSLIKEFVLNFWEGIFPLYENEYKLKEIFDSPLKVDDFKVQRTNLTEGYHMWHIENSSPDNSQRVMVYTLYLNDVEEGGETEFLIQSKRLTPKQGTLCIFPAGYTHIHRGNPPLSNTKYIMTGWISYNPPSPS